MMGSFFKDPVFFPVVFVKLLLMIEQRCDKFKVSSLFSLFLLIFYLNFKFLNKFGLNLKKIK